MCKFTFSKNFIDWTVYVHFCTRCCIHSHTGLVSTFFFNFAIITLSYLSQYIYKVAFSWLSLAFFASIHSMDQPPTCIIQFKFSFSIHFPFLHLFFFISRGFLLASRFGYLVCILKQNLISLFQAVSRDLYHSKR